MVNCQLIWLFLLFLLFCQAATSDSLFQWHRDAFKAVVNCRIFRVKRADWGKLTEKIPRLFILTKSLSEATLLNKIKDNDFLNFRTAADKYREFVKRYPDLALYVPQQYIASYLKITPQLLSRIQKTLVS